MKKNKSFILAIIYFICAVLNFINFAIGKFYVYIPLGCTFVILGFFYLKKSDDKEEKKK